MKFVSARWLAPVSVSLFSCCLAAAQTPAQTPAAPPSASAQRAPRPAPANIKALPRNVSGDQVIALMREYVGDLGVNCEFCHAQDPTSHRNNFASDANPLKETARYMITMTADLNDKYLADLPNRRYADPITCGTCHRGEKHPGIFVPPARPETPHPAAAATSPSVTR